MKTTKTCTKTKPDTLDSAPAIATNREAAFFGRKNYGIVMRRVLCGLAAGSMIFAGGCAMNDASQNKTSLEIQAYQSR